MRLRALLLVAALGLVAAQEDGQPEEEDSRKELASQYAYCVRAAPAPSPLGASPPCACSAAADRGQLLRSVGCQKGAPHARQASIRHLADAPRRAAQNSTTVAIKRKYRALAAIWCAAGPRPCE